MLVKGGLAGNALQIDYVFVEFSNMHFDLYFSRFMATSR